MIQVISVFTFFEIILCLFQLLNIVKSFNSYFEVTGSWVNPNITAMFIAISLPSFYTLPRNNKNILYRKYPYILIILGVIVLIALKCRTAFIGVTLAFILLHFRSIKKFSVILKTKSRYIYYSLFLVLFSILIVSFFALYNLKKESADSRLFVWNISKNLIKEKPIIGYGYGSFEREYNLMQARYFKTNSATSNEIKNSRFIRSPFNDYIENWIEGGVIGLIFLISIIIIVVQNGLRLIRTDDNDDDFNFYLIAFSSICAFFCMAFVNFQILSLPSLLLFSVFIGILFSHKKEILSGNRVVSLIVKVANKYIFRVLALFSFLFIIGWEIYCANEQIKVKTAHVLAKNGHNKEALFIYKNINEKAMHSSSLYYSEYGELLYNEKDYDNAITIFEKSLALSSHPEILIGIGKCYIKKNDFCKAIDFIQNSVFMVPSRVYPQFLLMNTYLLDKDTIKAMSVANNIVEFDNTFQNEKIDDYKRKAMILLLELQQKKESSNSIDRSYLKTDLVLSNNLNKDSELDKKLELTLMLSKDNRVNLEKALQYFCLESDSLKRKAMEFLISNMYFHYSLDYYWVDENDKRIPFNEFEYKTFSESINEFKKLKLKYPGIHPKKSKYYDMHVISPEFLINNVNRAFIAWEKPSAKHLTFNEFCEYILPYRVDKEPLQFWRDQYSKTFDFLTENTSSNNCVTQADRINSNLNSWFYITQPEQKRTDPLPMLGPLHLLHRKQGECFDACILAVYAMRSQGIPTSYEKVPYWATASGTHTMCSILDEKEATLGFEGASINPSEFKLNREPSKILRITFSPQFESPAMHLSQNLIPMGILKNINIKDVTKNFWPVDNIECFLDSSSNIVKSNAAFICVFNNFKWQPTWWSKVNKNTAFFKDMPRGVVYLPMFYRNDRLTPAGFPIALGYNNKKVLRPNPETKITIKIVEQDKYLVFRPGQRYLLYYWDNKWISCGEQIAPQNEKFMIFDNVPSNALYVLKPDYSKEKERPFIITEEGNRIWF
ncbi:MAG: O-antigen ligase family protein [Candidatus Delongbacteria bacterium]|nr:O-antigen ligase family protein [Candidatus Delongbacteria bacterium]